MRGKGRGGNLAQCKEADALHAWLVVHPINFVHPVCELSLKSTLKVSSARVHFSVLINSIYTWQLKISVNRSDFTQRYYVSNALILHVRLLALFLYK